MRAGPHGAARVASCHSVALAGLLCRRGVHEYALCAMLAVCSEAPRATRVRMCARQPLWRAFVCANLPSREDVGRALGGRKPAKMLLLRSRHGGTMGHAYGGLVDVAFWRSTRVLESSKMRHRGPRTRYLNRLWSLKPKARKWGSLRSLMCPLKFGGRPRRRGITSPPSSSAAAAMCTRTIAAKSPRGAGAAD